LFCYGRVLSFWGCHHPISDENLLLTDKSGITLAEAIQNLKALETNSTLKPDDNESFLSKSREDIANAKRDFSKVKAFIELHIEQGPVLESARKNIGVVTGVAGFTRFKISFLGEQNHSGTTPMAFRRDALVAASEAILCVEQTCAQEVNNDVNGTVGAIYVYPGAVNVIPGRADIYIDIRGNNPITKRHVIKAILQKLDEIGKRRFIKVVIERLAEEKPVLFSKSIIGVLDTICSEINIPSMKLYSGAGHDASFLAKATKAGMIFIPSVGGISHDPREVTLPVDVLYGTKVLLAALLRMGV
jgi:N-carbamoyl-L-amino-acid hydrolase